MSSWPTERQLDALKEVAAFQDERGYPMTYRELCDRLGLKSPASAYSLLAALEKKGAVKIMRGMNRAVTVTPRGRGWLLVDRARKTAPVRGA